MVCYLVEWINPTWIRLYSFCFSKKKEKKRDPFAGVGAKYLKKRFIGDTTWFEEPPSHWRTISMRDSQKIFLWKKKAGLSAVTCGKAWVSKKKLRLKERTGPDASRPVGWGLQSQGLPGGGRGGRRRNIFCFPRSPLERNKPKQSWRCGMNRSQS